MIYTTYMYLYFTICNLHFTKYGLHGSYTLYSCYLICINKVNPYLKKWCFIQFIGSERKILKVKRKNFKVIGPKV